MTALLTTLCHWLLLAWMAALPVHVHAQDQPQTCTFHLSADNSSLNQLQGGQVIGIQNPHTSGDQEGDLFRLQGGALYDPFSRGCWWATPSTVLVCDLVPPVRPDPVFAIDEYGHLVYNSSQNKFWACPVEVDGEEGTESGWNYYLALPEGMAADPDQDGGNDDDEDGWDDEWDGGWGGGEDWRRDEKARGGGVVGVCKSVRIDVVGFLDAWICKHIFPSSSSSSSDAPVAPSFSDSRGGEVTETGTAWTSLEELPSTAVVSPTGPVVTVTFTTTSTSTHQTSGAAGTGAGSTEAVL